jgi:hypothetical protein
VKLLIKFPTRQRPVLFFETLSKYISMSSGLHQIEYVISMDEDDVSMNNEQVRDRLNGLIDSGVDIKYFYGNSKTKIEAINADMEKSSGDWELVFNGQDDMIPTAEGYDDIMLKRLFEFFPDTDGALWINDQFMGFDQNCTIVACGRKYYERFGYIYNPAYDSLFADNEYTEVGKGLGRLQYISDRIMKHDWIGKNQSLDPLIQRNESSEKYTADKRVFEERKRLGFPVEAK